MAEPIRNYDLGSRVTHTLRVEVDDNPSDPTTLTVFFIDPLGVQTGPFTPTKGGKGFYFYQKTYSGAASAVCGDWTINWVGTGSAEGAKQRQFHINTSKFT